VLPKIVSTTSVINFEQSSYFLSIKCDHISLNIPVVIIVIIIIIMVTSTVIVRMSTSPVHSNYNALSTPLHDLQSHDMTCEIVQRFISLQVMPMTH